MFPLLQRDGQTMNYFICQALFAIALAAVLPYLGLRTEGWLYYRLKATMLVRSPVRHFATSCVCTQLSLIGFAVLHMAAPWLAQVPRWPDLMSVVFTAYAGVHFCAAYVLLSALSVGEAFVMEDADCEHELVIDVKHGIRDDDASQARTKPTEEHSQRNTAQMGNVRKRIHDGAQKQLR